MAKNKMYKPTNDVIFKLIFGKAGNEKITKSLIEEIIQKKMPEITLNNKLDLPKQYPEEKQMIADVIAKDKNDRKYIIEMQRKNYSEIIKRFFSYGIDIYLADLKKMKKYNELKQTTVIVIMEEPLKVLNNVNEYHTIIEFATKKHTEIEYEELIQMHIIELKKYIKQRKTLGKKELWLEFIINSKGREMEEMVRTKKELEEAVEQLKKLNADEEVRRIAMAEEWAEIDRISQLSEALQEGEMQGIAKGKEEGKAEGIAEEKSKIAKKMLAQGIAIEIIETVTGLSKEQINS